MKSLFCLICICSFFTLPLLDIYGADSSITCIKFETLGRLEPRPDLENYIETNNFKVHWESPTTQTYAQNAANYAEYARDQECNQLHWRVPPADGGRGGNDKYDIYILNDLNEIEVKLSRMLNKIGNMNGHIVLLKLLIL